MNIATYTVKYKTADGQIHEARVYATGKIKAAIIVANQFDKPINIVKVTPLSRERD